MTPNLETVDSRIISLANNLEEYFDKKSAFGLTKIIKFVDNCEPILIELLEKDSESDTFKNSIKYVVLGVGSYCLSLLEDAIKDNEYASFASLSIEIKGFKDEYGNKSLIKQNKCIIEKLNKLSKLDKYTSDRFEQYYKRFNEIYSLVMIRTGVSDEEEKQGCYIATMAYGDYDHPQVLELRKFRDNVLKRTVVGRVFIRVYYSTSPKLVRVLKNNKKINVFIRKGLDKLIKIIK